jgi:predicted amidohydrolase YtcJ
MPRYLVERTFPGGLGLPVNAEGAQAAQGIISRNAQDGVTWIHSYVVPDKKKTFCIYDAPTPEAIQRVAQRNGLPVDRIMEVRVLNPYFYL